MAEHYEIRPDQRGLAMRIAQRALRVANGLSTARPGYVYIPNGDGTGTWIGGEVGSGGVAEWIGDTTPPGRPTGCSCSSAWGTVYAKWDGTIEGGVPADLAYVEVTAGGAVLGRLSEAGTVAADGFEDGQQLDVTFVAWDDAKARDGSPAPNASDPTVVQVTVSNERDAIDEAVQEANDKADALQQEMTEVKTTVDGVEQDVGELTSQVSGAVEKADQSLSVATEAKQTADAISDTAERAYEDAQSALTQASSAVQTATQLQQTVEEDYLSKDEATGTYASKSDVTQTASDILSTVESEYQSKDGMGSYYTKTEVDQKNDAITTTVSEAVETADGAMEKATTVEQTVDGWQVTIDDMQQDSDASVNLLRNSDFSDGTKYWVTDGATASVLNTEYYNPCCRVSMNAATGRLYANNSTSFSHVTGEEYTLKFWARSEGASGVIRASVAGATSGDGVIGEWPVSTDSWTRCEATYTANTTGSLTFRLTAAGTFLIANVSLRRLSNSNGWAPSPLDPASTATNYLKFDSSGLVVGDQTAGTLGGNTIIKSNGVAIRQGTTELASFGPSTIELGKNSANSLINLCGGQGKIKVATNIYGTANDLIIDAPNRNVSIGDSHTHGPHVSVSNPTDTVDLRGEYLNVDPNSGNIFRYDPVPMRRLYNLVQATMQLWSGTWVTGSITVPDINNYAVLIFACNSGLTEFGIAVRYRGGGRFIAFSMNPRSSLGFTFDTAAWTVSGTRVTKSTNAHATLTGSNGSTGSAWMSQNTGGVYRIWGVL